MGFINWKTADTKEPIIELYVGQSKPAYLLQPNGESPIREDGYQGYGIFGGVDVHIWLAKVNANLLTQEAPSDDDLRTLGVGLEVGSVYVDKNGVVHHVFHDYRLLIPGTFHDCTFDKVLDGWGKSPNELIADGTWKEVLVKDKLPLHNPLKFSFDPTAKYEDLPASQRCY